MRIVAGSAKGRKIDAPKAGTRPMTGRARESIFSILGRRVVDARVLDLYAGSGSLGLEALSRGAAGAIFVEKSRSAGAVVEGNIDRVNLGGCLRRSDVRAYLRSAHDRFAVVFVDPPYADTDSDVEAVLALIEPVLEDNGIVVLHRQARSDVSPPEFLHTVDERRYGDAVVTMMERAKE
jgi:16S rRNA (guanine966-N2)-methyltransferase